MGNTEELAVVESAIITVEEDHQHEIETPSENVITKVTESDVYENNVEELEQMTVVESAVKEAESANINSGEDLQHDTETPTNNLVPQITIQKQIVAEEHTDESVLEEVQLLQEEPEKDLGNVQKETPSNIGEPIQDKTKEIDQSNLSIIKEDISDSLLQKEEEPLYKDPEDSLETNDNHESHILNEVSIVKVEDQYVTAEEVRIQKHKVVVKDEMFPEDQVITQSIPVIAVENQDLTNEPTILEETSLLSNRIPLIVPMVTIPVHSAVPEEEETDPEKNAEVENIRTSKDVEQLLRDISDPNLDCSLEDIEAMIDGKELVPPKEELNRVSPEFATAATLIDQNPDKGFDPEDPAVKGIEDWECSNLNTSLESVESRSSKLKSVFKRRRSRSEERKSLLDNRSNDNHHEEEDEEEKVSMGCINSWLLYIFIKIFD